MKRWFIIGSTVAVLIAGAAITVSLLSQKSPQPAKVENTAASTPTNSPEKKDTVLAAGRYTPYIASEVANSNYDTTILFFHAPWCVECRGFEKAINEGDIPNGVQILKLDYDSSTALRKKYGVTIQTTFVRVNSGGEKQSVWVGYGKDKTIDTILQNTK